MTLSSSYSAKRRLDEIAPAGRIMPERAAEPLRNKPKILLVDMPETCARVLKQRGYNAAIGSFGIPYKVKRSNGLYHVSLESSHLPNLEEQEIVILNTADPAEDEAPPLEQPGDGVEAVWQSGIRGSISQRPACMHFTQSKFEHLRRHGSLFIVLASEKTVVRYLVGANFGRDGLKQSSVIEASNWSFLRLFHTFTMGSRQGSEIVFEKGLGELLKRGARDAAYSCVLHPSPDYEQSWFPLAKNKYGETVAAMIGTARPARLMLLLPQMPHLHEILVELLEDWYAEIRPEVFPGAEKAKWVHGREYETPEVLAITDEIERVRQEAAVKIAALEVRREEMRVKHADTYTLLRGEGEELVGAVLRTLRELGFAGVVDVAEAGRAKGEARNLREDVQIHDRSPVLIVDVKGVAGHAGDDDPQQAERHAMLRMREWGRTDVQPLVIVNHQRQRPPRERDPLAYRDEICAAALSIGCGLMTTWDLFRLARSAKKLGWTPAEVLPIFYRKGPIEPHPEHYRAIGEIESAWARGIGVLATEPLTPGARLAVAFEDEFREVNAGGVTVDGRPKNMMGPGDARRICDIACDGAAEWMRKGMRVYLVG